MKISKADKKELHALLHELVKLRDGDKCLRCHRPGSWQMSHIYPKGRYRRMEYEPDNIKPLCYACHLCWWHKDPIGASAWLNDTLPLPRLQRLKLMAQVNAPFRMDIKLYKLFLKQEIKKYAKLALS